MLLYSTFSGKSDKVCDTNAYSNTAFNTTMPAKEGEDSRQSGTATEVTELSFHDVKQLHRPCIDPVNPEISRHYWSLWLVRARVLQYHQGVTVCQCLWTHHDLLCDVQFSLSRSLHF